MAARKPAPPPGRAKRNTRGSEREASGKESLLLDREALRHWRLQRGFTQQALAQQRVQLDGQTAQISYAQIRRIEKEGRAGPASARLLAALLGVELAQLRPRDARQLPCGLPREVSVDFVGRRAELDAVLAILAREGNVRIAASVEGLPGIGKTELALQVCAHLERTRSFRIFWLNAENPDLTAEWGETVARHLGIDHPEQRERARLALRVIEGLGETTLLVLDNVERWSASEPWPRPQGRHLRWLVTTRSSRLGERAFEHIEVPVLDEPSAIDLLTRIGGAGLAQRPGFRELVRYLDGYTIALELAAVFLGRFPEVEPSEYLKLLVQGKSDVVEEEVRTLTSYERTLEGSLQLLWSRLSSRTRAAWELAASFAQDTASNELSDACGLDRRVRAELRDFHLIQGDVRGWTMHRLVRAFAVRRMSPSAVERSRAALIAGCALRAVSAAGGDEYLSDRTQFEWALQLASELLGDEMAVLADLRLGIGEARVGLGLLPDPKALLERAAEFYRGRLAELDPANQALDYSRSCAKLGRALFSQTVWRFEIEVARDAVRVLRDCVRALDREAFSSEWAGARRLLGQALELLERHGEGRLCLEEAIECYRSALPIDAGSDPLQALRTQHLLAKALGTLSDRSLDGSTLEEAVRTYEAALTGIARAQHPLQWGRLHAGLGAVLLRLWDQTGNPSFADRAVSECRLALEVLGRDNAPLDRSTTQYSLASALRAQGEIIYSKGDPTQGIAAIRAAAQSLRDARDVCDRQLMAVLWSDIHRLLALILCHLGSFADDVGELEESIACAQEALRGHTRERNEVTWATTQSLLGFTLSRCGALQADVSRSQQGVALCREVVDVLSRETESIPWGAVQGNLAESLIYLGHCSGERAPFAEALVFLRKAQSVHDPVLAERRWRLAQNEIERIESFLAESQGESQSLVPRTEE